MPSLFRIPQPALSLVLTCITKLHPKSVFPVLQGCSQCTASSCLQCAEGLFQDSNGACLQQCPDGFFPNLDTRICDACSVGCSRCYGPSLQECFECSSNYHFIQIFTCMPSCTSSFFFYHTTHTCLRKINLTLACHSECASCFGTSSDSCSSCAIGRTL